MKRIKKLTQKRSSKITLAVGGLSATLSFIHSSCSDSFMKSRVADKTSISAELAATADAAGNYSAAMDPSSTSTQLMRASSGAVAGSAIAMPAGALSVPVTVTIGQGETLASSDVTQQLGMTDNSASAAGPAVSFMPSSNVQATSAFTLSIPVTSSSSLAAVDTGSLSKDLTVVMYKWMKVDGATVSYEVGILPPKELTIGSKTVQFQTKMFGTFQLAQLAQPITERIKKPTIEPPVLKADAGNPLVGVWSMCREDKPYYGSSSSSSTSGGSNSSGSTTLNIGPTVGNNGCFADPVGAGAPPEILWTFQDFGGVTATPGQFQLVRIRDNSVTIGTFPYSTVGPNLKAPLPGGTPVDIQPSEQIMLIAPDGCYFDLPNSAPTRVLPFTQSGYNQTFAVKATNSNQLQFNGAVNDNSSDPQLVPGDSIKVTSIITGTSLNTTSTYYFSGSAGLANNREFTLSNGSSNIAITQNDEYGIQRVGTSIPVSAGAPVAIFQTMFPFAGNERIFVNYTNTFLEGFVKDWSYTYPNVTYTFKDAFGSAISLSAAESWDAKTKTCRPVNRIGFVTVNGQPKKASLMCPSPGVSIPLPSNIASLFGSSSTSGQQSGSNTNNTGNNNSSDSHRLGIPGDRPVFQKEYVKFSSNTFIHSSSNFPGPNCTGPMISRTEETGSYTLNGNTSGDGIYNITIKMGSARAGILEPPAVQYANQNAACGMTDWAVGVPKDLESTPLCKYSNQSKGNQGPEALKIQDGKRLIFKNSDGTWEQNAMTRE
jgi:hypothetical protein